jgi:3-dehydroquinate dehydratase
MKDLKPVYQAETLELAELRLDQLEEKWGKKYEKVLGILAQQLVKTDHLFPIRRGCPKADLHDQYHRRVSPPSQESH